MIDREALEEAILSTPDEWDPEYDPDYVYDREAKALAGLILRFLGDEGDEVPGEFPLGPSRARKMYATQVWATRKFRPSEAKKDFDRMLAGVRAEERERVVEDVQNAMNHAGKWCCDDVVQLIRMMGELR